MRVGEEKNERDDFSSNIVIAKKTIVPVFSDSQIHLMENAAKCKINRIPPSDD